MIKFNLLEIGWRVIIFSSIWVFLLSLNRSVAYSLHHWPHLWFQTQSINVNHEFIDSSWRNLCKHCQWIQRTTAWPSCNNFYVWVLFDVFLISLYSVSDWLMSPTIWIKFKWPSATPFFKQPPPPIWSFLPAFGAIASPWYSSN